MKTVTVTLCILTALVTGLHNFYWLMDMVNGAPLNLLNLTALLGALTLVGAAAVVPFRPHVAAKIGLAGSLLLWVYYAPLIAVSVLCPLQLVVKFEHSFRTRNLFRSWECLSVPSY